MVTICLNCFVSNHNNHTIEVLTELCQKLCEDIQNETKELQQRIIPTFEKMSCEEDENLKKLNEAYDKLESSIEELGKDLHRRVDEVVSKYKTNVQLRKQADAMILQQQKESSSVLISHQSQFPEIFLKISLEKYQILRFRWTY